jgi:signal transduction histidine kinase
LLSVRLCWVNVLGRKELHMEHTIETTFSRLSLSRQYLVASFPILFVGMLALGWWVGRMIEQGVVHRMGALTSHYVESFVSPHLQHLAHHDSLDEAHRAALGTLLTDTPLGKRIVAFKIWDRQGRVIYSTNAASIGRAYPIGEGLAAALAGNVHSEISDLEASENEAERSQWSRLVETYSPIHAEKLGTVIAAAEIYQVTDELSGVIRDAQLRSWLLVSTLLLVMYLLIFGLVRRGSQTIDAQRGQLNRKVDELSALAAQNKQLHEKVRRAAVRTTALNERFLRRISADLHDGPGQDLALALMRIDTLASAKGHGLPGELPQPKLKEDLQAIHSTLKCALAELRSISLGLNLPEIDGLSSSEIAARAVRDFERKTGANVKLKTSGNDPVEIALPVKITLYRLVQESLTNGFRHGGGAAQCVSIAVADDHLDVIVNDNGKGFDVRTVNIVGHVGLEGMRERVEVLGGSFQLHSAIGQGTDILVSLPLQVAGIDHE